MKNEGERDRIYVEGSPLFENMLDWGKLIASPYSMFIFWFDIVSIEKLLHNATNQVCMQSIGYCSGLILQTMRLPFSFLFSCSLSLFPPLTPHTFAIVETKYEMRWTMSSHCNYPIFCRSPRENVPSGKHFSNAQTGSCLLHIKIVWW